jgi:molecular chaperone GrpE
MPQAKKKKEKKHPDVENLDETLRDEYNEDVVFEEEDNESRSIGGSREDKVKKLKEKLNKCLKENRENLLGWQRTRADFVNAKKENEEKTKQSFIFAKRELTEDLLPVIDSFEMAFSNKEAWENVDKQWRIGVEYIYTQMLDILKDNGLKQINPISQKFDPMLHTSMEVVDTNNKKEDDMVVSVVQKGYEMNGRVIRPAKVRVGRYKK